MKDIPQVARCHACNIYYSPETARRHYMSKNHRKNIQKKEIFISDLNSEGKYVQ